MMLDVGNGRSKVLGFLSFVLGIFVVLEVSSQQNRVRAGFVAEYEAAAIVGLLAVACLIGSLLSRQRPLEQLPPPPPPGSNPARWAPDPSGEYRLRWWDGERWTDHTHD